MTGADAATTTDRRGTAARSGLLIAGSFALSSALGAVLLAVVARWLSPEENATFLAVWALVFGIGGAMSAVDAEVSRLATRAAIAGEQVPAQVGPVTAVGAVGGLALALLLSLLPGLRPALWGDPSALAWVVAAVVLFAPLSLVRGVLIGSGRVPPYVVVVLGEAVLRTVVALGLWVWVDSGSTAGALAAVAAGGLAWLPLAPKVSGLVAWRTTTVSWGRAVRTVAALGSANGLSTLLLAGYPVLVTTVLGSTAGLQVLFAGVVLTRIPLVAVAPLQAVAVPLATRALHAGHAGRLRRMWAFVAAALLVACAVAAVLGWHLGPWAIRVFQGPRYDAPPGLMAVLLAATFVLAVALPQLAVMVAAERHTWVTASWSVAVVTTVAWLWLGDGSPQWRGAVGFALGACTVYAAGSIGLLTVTRQPPRPGTSA